MKTPPPLSSGDSYLPGNDPGCWIWFLIGLVSFLAIVLKATLSEP